MPISEIDVRVVQISALSEECGLNTSSSERIGGNPIVHIDPVAPAFAADGSWGSGARQRGEALAPGAGAQAFSLAPAIDDDGHDAEGVVQVYLEHRLARGLSEISHGICPANMYTEVSVFW